MIETERLTIRLPQVADVPEIIRYYGENRDHLQPFSPTFAPDFLDEAIWLEQVRVRLREFAARESFRAFIYANSAPRRIAGNLNLTQVYRGAFQSCVLGYNLAHEEEGKGYMTEAVNGALAFAFGTWNLHRVAAGNMPRNSRSAAVLRRCGFQIEGHASAYLMLNGRWEDHVLTAIINKDLPAI
ncbi:MAG: [ribosomal protein S5]-alanine N-acetyltransferase [Chloroflexota bacterium]|nr:[ribosomal protein S5]-alanine N-acetyltransferase [Chloroflexota bacterium]